MIWSILAIFSWRLESCWWKELANKQFLQENQWWWWFKNHFPSSFAAGAPQTCSLAVVVVVGLSVCLSLLEETNFVLGFVLGESKQQLHFMEKEKINQFMVSWRTQDVVQSNRPQKFACLLVVRNHETLLLVAWELQASSRQTQQQQQLVESESNKKVVPISKEYYESSSYEDADDEHHDHHVRYSGRRTRARTPTLETMVSLAKDGTVDCSGKPIDKRTSGRLRANFFIIGNKKTIHHCLACLACSFFLAQFKEGDQD